MSYNPDAVKKMICNETTNRNIEHVVKMRDNCYQVRFLNTSQEYEDQFIEKLGRVKFQWVGETLYVFPGNVEMFRNSFLAWAN